MAEENRFRKKEIRVKLSAEEYEILKQKAFEYDITMSEFVRMIGLYGGIRKAMPRIDEQLIKDLIWEVNRIGNNINQIAYNTNIKYSTELNELENAKKECYSVLGQLVNVLYDVG